MFGWDFHHSKADRIKLFLFILAVFLLVGFTSSYVFRSMNGSGEEVKEATPIEEGTPNANAVTSSVSSPQATEDVNQYDQTEHFSEEELDKTKKLAVEFVKAFHSYSVDEPMKYLETAQSFMTNFLYEDMERTPRREPLNRSYLTVKETNVTQVVNPSSMVVRWNVMVKGTSKSVDGEESDTEDWYLVGVREVNGEWKVEDVRVNVPN
jgi:hypothetical protein